MLTCSRLYLNIGLCDLVIGSGIVGGEKLFLYPVAKATADSEQIHSTDVEKGVTIRNIKKAVCLCVCSVIYNSLQSHGL